MKCRVDRIAGVQRGVDDEGNILSARDLIKEAIELDDSVAELWIRLAFVETELGNHLAAVSAARQATSLTPQAVWTHTALGLSLRASDRDDEAISAYRAALSISPGHEPALIAAAAIAESRGDEALAVELYENAVAASALGDLSRVLYAQLLFRMGNAAGSEELLRSAAGNVDNELSRRSLIGFLHAQDRSGEAKEWLENFAEIEPRWEAFAELGQYLLSQTNNGPAARDALRTSIDMGADEPFVFSALAKAMVVSGHSDEDVSAVVLEMLSKFSDQAEAWVQAANVYEVMDDEAEAEAAYRSAMQREDGRRGRVMLAQFLEGRLDRVHEAESLFREAVEAETGRSKCIPMRRLAEHLIHRGDDEAALSVLQAATIANDRCGCCRVLYGEWCRRNGELQSAEEQYRQALAIDEHDVGALTGLAHVVGKTEAAKLIAKALESDSADPRALLASLKWSDLEKSERINGARRLAEDYPDFLEASLFSATVEADAGDLRSAVDRLERTLNEIHMQQSIIPLFVKSAMTVVESGGGKLVSELLASHRNRTSVEPLAVAIGLAAGETPLVANEVLQVARDILSRSSHLR